VSLQESVQDLVGIGEDAVSEEEDVRIVGAGRAGDERGEQGGDWQTLGLGSEQKINISI